MLHKYDEGATVIHDGELAIVVGYCLVRTDDAEPRYGIELLNKRHTIEYSNGLTKDFKIVLAVGESELTLVEAPKEEEKVVEPEPVKEQSPFDNFVKPTGVA